MTEARFLSQMVDRSQGRIRDLARVGGSQLSKGCDFASRHPGWLVAAGFAAAFVVGRAALPRMPGAGQTRVALGFVAGALARVARSRLVDALSPGGDG